MIPDDPRAVLKAGVPHASECLTKSATYRAYNRGQNAVWARNTAMLQEEDSNGVQETSKLAQERGRPSTDSQSMSDSIQAPAVSPVDSLSLQQGTCHDVLN